MDINLIISIGTLILGLVSIILQYHPCKVAIIQLKADRKSKEPNADVAGQIGSGSQKFSWKPLLPSLFMVLFVIAGSYSIVRLNHELAIANRTLPAKTASAIPDPIPEYEIFCETNSDATLFKDKALSAFDDRHFAYAILFLKKCKDVTPNPSWEFAKPVLLAAEYAQNPTAKGQAQFETEIKKQLEWLEKGEDYAGNPGYLAKVLNSYMRIRPQLPSNEKVFLDGISGQVEKLKDKREK